MVEGNGQKKGKIQSGYLKPMINSKRSLYLLYNTKKKKCFSNLYPGIQVKEI